MESPAIKEIPDEENMLTRKRLKINVIPNNPIELVIDSLEQPQAENIIP